MPGSELHTLPHVSLIPPLGVKIIINFTLHTGKQSLREWTCLPKLKLLVGTQPGFELTSDPKSCVHSGFCLL